MSEKKPAERVLAFIRDHAWSILPASLESIQEIASRTNEYDAESLAAKVGQRMQGSQSVEMRGRVAVLNIEGPLFRYANLFTMFSGATSFDVLATDFNAALDNPNVDAIVLNVNSPGGMTDGTSEFANMVYAARERKKVVAYVSHMGASAAYWIASAAETIQMADTASVGSIGTVAQIKTGKEKDTVEIVSAQSPKKRPDVSTDEGKQVVQEYVDALSEVFIKTVARNRGVSVETVLKDFGQGGILVGEKAVAVGMADGISSLESVIAGLSGKSSNRKETKMSEKKTVLLSEVTLAMLMAERPELVASIQEDAEKKGRGEGAKAELERVKAVQAASLPGHEKLINELMFDGTTTGDQAASKVLAAERAARVDRTEQLRKDAPNPAAPSSVAQPGNADKGKEGAVSTGSSLEETKAAVKAEWDSNADLREEFSGDFEAFASFKHQEARGNVKYLKQKSA